jgi:hypothetical protein
MPLRVSSCAIVKAPHGRSTLCTGLLSEDCQPGYGAGLWRWAMAQAAGPRLQAGPIEAGGSARAAHRGEPTTVIGYEESEQLEVEPAKYFVLVTKREKRTCRCCERGRMVAAPAPVRIIDKSVVSDRPPACTGSALRAMERLFPWKVRPLS